MRIGTTPTHTFTIPADLAGNIGKVRVIYAQGDDTVLTRDLTELTGNDAVVKLTQEETLKFHMRKTVKIQLHVLMSDGTALTSDIIKKSPYELLGMAVLV